MKRVLLGPVLVFLGIFGGGFLWLVLIGIRFEYLITVVYDGADPGEAIWALDPIFTILAAVPGIILALIGLSLSLKSSYEQPIETKSKVSFRELNLFYLGEICLLVTIVVSIIGFLGISGLIVELVQISAILMALIALTCITHMFSLVLRNPIRKLGLSKFSRNTAILLTIELMILILVVLTLRLYTWSLIRTTTLVIAVSGFLGLVLITPRFLKVEGKNGAEGEI